MKMNIEHNVLTALENGMDYILKQGWTFKKLSKGLIVLVSLGMVLVTMSTGWGKEEASPHIKIANAKELDDEIVEDLHNSTEIEADDVTEAKGITDTKKEESSQVESTKPTIDTLWVNNTAEERAFLTEVAQVAVEVAREYNIYPSIVVAQAVLESDWGTSELAVNANNYFGVKGSYNGNSYAKLTKEDDGTGVQTEIVAGFAKYPTMRESIESNAQLLRNGTNFDAGYYQGAWVENAHDYSDATKALTGTYATDIHYNTKVDKVIESHHLQELDKIVYE